MNSRTTRSKWIGGAIAGALSIALIMTMSMPAQGTSDTRDPSLPSLGPTSALGDIRAQERIDYPVYMRSGMPLASGDVMTASAERGLSLGGIGAGSFQINKAGTFGPWNLGGGAAEWRTLPQAALHVREQVGNAKPNVKTLAVNGSGTVTNEAWNLSGYPVWEPGVLEGFPTVPAGSGRYSALFPFGQIDYKSAAEGGPLATQVTTRFWSPQVQGDASRSSLPVAYFDVTVTNPTKKATKVSTMFTFPNAQAHVAGTGPRSWIGGGTIAPEAVGTGVSTRVGLDSKVDTDRKSGITGVTLSASDPANTPDTQNSDWTIATVPGSGQKASYVTSWNGDGNGSDIIKAFSAKANLPNKALDDSSSAGAVAVSATLAPGKSQTFHYVLAWDFPQDVYTAGTGDTATTTVWMRRYTEFFGARSDDQNNYIAGSYKPHQGWTIAKTVLKDRKKNLADVLKWWQPMATDERIPEEIRVAGLNQMAYLLSGGSFWEAGLVSNTAPAGGGSRLGAAVPDTHLFAIQTGADGGDASVMSGDVLPYAFRAITEFMPEAELGYLRAATEVMQRQGGLGNMSSVTPGSPYVTYNQDGSRSRLQADADWFYRVWNYYRSTGDEEFFRYAYPVMVSQYDRDKTRSGMTDTQLLPIGNGTTHDLLPVNGSGIYLSTAWLTALAVMQTATGEARRLGITEATAELETQVSERFLLTKEELETQLWDAEGEHYRFDTGTSSYSRGIFADATYQQYLVNYAGLPDIMDVDRVRLHLKAVYEKAAAPFVDDDGRMAGAVNLLDNDDNVFGGIVQTGNPFLNFFRQTTESREIWTGVQYPLAALMVEYGETYSDNQLREYGVDLGTAVAYQSWYNEKNGYAFQVPEAAGVVMNPPGIDDPAVGVPPSEAKLDTQMHRNLSYGRPLSSWDLLSTMRIARSAEDTTRPSVTLVTPTTAGPYKSLELQVDASDAGGLQRIVANVYKDGKVFKSTQTALAGEQSGTHTASLTLPDGNYSVKYNAQDRAGNTSKTGLFEFSIDATAPTATVKEGSEFTVGAEGSYDKVSFKLYDAGKVDKVELNGVVKDLTDNSWSDVNFLEPGVFGASEGENVLIVYDVAGNTSTTTFTLN